MTEIEVKRIAREAARCAVEETFTKLGVDMSGPDSIIEVQQDFAWLRKRRLLEGKIGTKARLTIVTTVIGLVITGALAAFWAVLWGHGNH